MTMFGVTGFQASTLKARPAKEILPEDVYLWAKQNLSRKEMAKLVGLTYPTFSARVANSLSLSTAERRGRSESENAIL